MSEIAGFGKYQLLRRLGEGGMAEVFLARVSTGALERPVVIKRLLPHLNHNEAFSRMFLDEVRISSLLQHANIVQVFDFGMVEHQYFLALEYVWGRSLDAVISALLSRNERVPMPIAVAIAADVCRALDHAHHKKDPTGKPMAIVHRDVSPSNILLSFEGEVKLADFGIARAADRLMQTDAGDLKGKASYMAPEQVIGRPATPLADLFALGVVLYEMLSMRALFTGANPLETLANVRRADVPPLGPFAPGLPRDLERLVMRMLSAQPRDRLPSGELLAALENIRRQLPPADLKAFLRELFASERAADEESFQRLFTLARRQDATALHLHVEGKDAAEIERRFASPAYAPPIFVPTDAPQALGSRVHLLLEAPDAGVCLRVEGQVVELAEGGMKIRLQPSPVLPVEENPDGGTVQWLSAIERRRRKRWPLVLAAVGTLAIASMVAVVAGRRSIDQSAQRAFSGVEKAIATGHLDQAGSELAAARRKFPHRPEAHALAIELAAAWKREGLRALAARRFADAVRLLEHRGELVPPDRETSAALARARTGALASGAGMVEIADFWIDRYEYPNAPGAPPLTRVDFAAAAALCERAGKRLCTEAEWQRACAGPEGRAYPYGARFLAGRCVAGTHADGPMPAGSRPECTTPEGVADLSGNVAEWTSTPFRTDGPQRVVRGGHWEQSGAEVSCTSRDYFLPGQGGARTIGFRCCR